MKGSDDSLSNEKKIKNKKERKNSNKWIYYVFIITFILSITFGSVSNVMIDNLNVGVATLILVVIIAIGIVFDMIGMSVVTCNEATFHAKAARKQNGAKEAVKLVKYADKVSSVCNDVVGDVCGVISGAVSAMLAIKFANMFNLDAAVISLVLGAIVASLTVGGKAIEKAITIKHAETVIYNVGKILYYINPCNLKIKNKKK